MSKRQVNQDQFNRIRETVGKAESAVKRVPISAISVDVDTLKRGRILVDGNEVKVNPIFFSKLGQLLKMNVSLTRDMMKKEDHKFAAALINGLKSYTSKNKTNSDVMLIANMKNKEIMDICSPSRYRRVTNDTLFDVTERILNDNPHLILETVDFNPGNGTASINLLNNEQVGFAQAGKDEFFKFGFSIIQTTKDTIVESYNQRLVCTNGMRASLGGGAIGGNSNKALSFEDKFRLGGTSAEEVQIFLNKIDLMRKSGFVPGGFEDVINRATGTKASLYEVERALKLANKKLDEPDPELKKGYQSAIAQNYFPGYGTTLARINRKGTDSSALNDKQKAFIKTGMSVWDVINSLTFLGSNNSGMPLEDKYELKYQAGDLFSKANKEGYDLEYAQYASL
jgi:hypothetical protein